MWRDNMETEENVRAQMGVVPDRRLDELAWLLEGSSMCTAIAAIGNRFYISANEFSTRTRDREHNRQLDLMCQIMTYFKQLAGSEIADSGKPAIRDELMKEIIRFQISTSSFGRISISDNILDAVISSEVLHKGQLPQGLAETDLAHMALGYGIMINKRMRKIENSIEKALNSDFTDITKNQLEAFANFTHDDNDKVNSNILFFERESGVHAELQILSQLIGIIAENEDTAPKEVYIGISKRCCLNCDCMLKAANDVLASKGIEVKYEGTHGASFAANWIRPLGFSGGSTSTKSVRTGVTSASSVKEAPSIMPLQAQIFQKYRELLEAAMQAEGAYSQRHALSSSDYSSNPEERAGAYKEQLESDLEAFERRGAGSSDLAKMLELGLDLCKIDEFNDLFDEKILSTIKSSDEARKRFNDVLSKLNVIQAQEQKPAASKETLLEFLKDPHFSNTQIAGLFSQLGSNLSASASSSSGSRRLSRLFGKKE